MKFRFLTTILLFTQIFVAALYCPAYATPVPGVSAVAGPASGPDCPSDVFEPIPGDTSHLLGRYCPSTSFRLELFNVDWAAKTISDAGPVLNCSPCTPAQGGSITSVYDPTMAAYNGELWVAFECITGGPASACIGPYTPGAGVDASRISVVVDGVSFGSDGYSASVPKIFVHAGVPYLYWSTVHLKHGADGDFFNDITTRGVQLTQEGSGLRRLFANGFIGNAMSPIDPASSEVLGLGSDSISDAVADSFQVVDLGSQILLFGALGGKGCGAPTDVAYGCYRPQVFSSTTPLGTHVFNSAVLASPNPLFNPQEYTKVFTDNSGSKVVLGQYLPASLNGSPLPDNGLSSNVPNLLTYPTNTSTYSFGSTDPTPLPNPTFATGYIQSERFAGLQQFLSTCSGGNTIPNAAAADCFAAAHRFCQGQGYELGGLVVQTNGVQGNLGCARSSHGTSVTVDMSALTAYQANCVDGNQISGDCYSAMDQYCGAIGYGGGAFGPEEYSAPNTMFSCMDTTAADKFAVAFTDIQAYHSACSETWTASAACFSAVDSYCLALGYLGGFGIQEHVPGIALIGCFKRNVPN